ncbi:MAG: AAA family ATPase [Ilumatobacteraceae bacterium]
MTTPGGLIDMGQLVGRDAELGVVDDVLGRTRAGGCRTLLIRGDEGTGRSRLLEAVTAHGSPRGFAAIVGSAHDHDRGVAYATLRLALHDRLVGETSPRLAPTASRLDMLLFGRTAPDPPVTTTALDLVHELVTGWADRQPLILAIDDLDRADPETLETFTFLARHLSGSRVLLAATVRSRRAELAPDVVGAIDRLRASRTTTVVDVGALHGPDLAALICSLIGREPSPRLLELVEDATGGNVFFAVELVRSLRDDGAIECGDDVADLAAAATPSVPSSAGIAVLQRVFRLGETAWAVARVGAAFTALRVEQLALVAELTRLDREAVEEAFDLLIRVGILTPSADGYRFAHGIVRSALYDDLGPAERTRVHERIATDLRARRDAGLPVDVVELATHVRSCAAAGDAGAAVILVEAGDSVVGATPRSAVEWYRDALALIPPAGTQAGEVNLRLARALGLASLHADAADAAAAAMATLPEGDDWTKAGALRVRALAVSGQASAAAQLFDELADLSALRRPRILAQRALLLDSLDRIPEAAAVIAEADLVADGDSRMWVEIPRLHLAMSSGDWTTGRRIADALAADLPSLPLLGRASTAISLVNVHSNNGDPHVALDVAAVLGDSPLWTSMAAGPIARALTRVGRWDDGLTVAADAIAQDGDRGLLYLAWLTIAFVAAERAEPPLDVEVVRAGLSAIELYPTTALLCLAYLDVAEGRDERARSHLAAAADRDGRTGRCNVLPWTLDLQAELDWFAGDAASAIEASRRLDALVDDDAWLVARLSALLTRAVVRADLDAAGQAEQLAVEHDLPLERGRAIAAQGTLTDDADRLADAYSRFAALGATRRQRRTSMELRRLGRRVPRGPANQSELSAAERQLAALVAQGFTNREIAERVHLSAKTIEVYLGRIFRKAGCTSRLELALAVNSGRLGFQEQGVPYSNATGPRRSLVP